MAGPVFFCYDGSDDARTAIQTAGEALPGGPAVVATAWQPIRHSAIWSAGLAAELGGGVDELDDIARNHAQEHAAEGCEIARGAGFTAEPIACKAEGAVWAALMHRAEDHHASLVVVGRRGLSRVAAAVLGSVSLGLVNHASCPVLVVPSDRRTEGVEEQL